MASVISDVLGRLEGSARGERLDAVATAVAEQLRADPALGADVERLLEGARSALDDLLALEASTGATQGGVAGELNLWYASTERAG